MQFSTSLPNTKQITIALASVFTLGTVTLLTLVLAAILGAALAIVWLVNLAFIVLVELTSHIATLYAHSDSAVQLFIIVLILWCVVKAAAPVIRSLRASFTC
jgi:hypothetical protein